MTSALLLSGFFLQVATPQPSIQPGPAQLPAPPVATSPPKAAPSKPVKFVPRPYVPPKLDPEPALEPSDVKVIEVKPQGEEKDSLVLSRPFYPSPMVGAAALGT